MTAQTKLHRTRAEAIGCKPKVLAARTKRSLKSIRERIETLAAPWEEIDSNIELYATELLGHFEEFEQRINETVDFLHETVEW